jgi:uncharacterized protein (UPF0335 family)
VGRQAIAVTRRAAGALPEAPVNRVVTNLPQLDAATEERSMSDKTGIPGNRIRSFVERVEQLEAEIQELNEGKKEVFAEAIRLSQGACRLRSLLTPKRPP